MQLSYVGLLQKSQITRLVDRKCHNQSKAWLTTYKVFAKSHPWSLLQKSHLITYVKSPFITQKIYILSLWVLIMLMTFMIKLIFLPVLANGSTFKFHSFGGPNSKTVWEPIQYILNPYHVCVVMVWFVHWLVHCFPVLFCTFNVQEYNILRLTQSSPCTAQIYPLLHAS